MKRLLLLTVVFFFIHSIFAQIPSGYYDSAEGQTGESLKIALHNIIDDHTEYSYDDIRYILDETDQDPNNTNNIILLYKGTSVSGVWDYGVTWNREHVWAKYHGDFGTDPPAGSDLHHLRPTDVSVNNDRGNLDFDYSDNFHSEATECKWDSDSWEPRNEVKGDVARMMFYMATRYEGDATGEPDLELVDYISGFTSEPIFGKLSTLIEWHTNDPVDDFERNRNEVIYSYQGNRNPFIDHPEYVAQIWGGSGNIVPVISNIAISPETPKSTDAVSVSSSITDSDGSISSAELHWGTSSGSLENTITMTVSSGDIYTTNSAIPTQSNGTIIYYKIEATDNESGVTSSSEDFYTVQDNPLITIFEEDFETSTENQPIAINGWTLYNESGTKSWEGRIYNSNRYAQMSAYNSGEASNITWLVSPQVDLTNIETATFSFITKDGYNNGEVLTVFISTDYTGTGNPNSATWTSLNPAIANGAPTNGYASDFTNSGNIDFTAYCGSIVYIAYKYSGGDGGVTTTMQVDDVLITGVEAVNEAPVISNIQMNPSQPDQYNDITISATITDSDGTISSAVLKWGTTSGAYINDIVMSSVDDVYSGTITAQAADTEIYYITEAIDEDDSSTISDEYSVTIVKNQIPLISDITNNPLIPEETDDITISTSITDPDGTVSSATLKWGTTAGSYPNELTMNSTGDVYSGVITTQTGGTKVHYIIEAIDDDGDQARSDEKSFTVNMPGNNIPVISNISFNPTKPTSSESVTVTATITDADGTNPAATLKWGTSFYIHNNTVEMTRDGDTYTGAIPALSDGTHVYFIIVADDSNGGVVESAQYDYIVDDPNVMPEITGVNFDPLEPGRKESVRVSASIADSDGTIMISKILWGTESGVYTQTDTLIEESGNSFLGTIPAQPHGSHIYFIVYAEDNEGGIAESVEFDYMVDDPNILPVISDVNFDPLEPESTDEIRVSSTITDSDGTIVVSKILWGTETGIYNHTDTLTEQSANSFLGTIPVQPDGSHIYFVIYTEDDEGGSSQSIEYDYLVDDLIAPEISNVTIDPANPTDNDVVNLSATITDIDGTISSAELQWGLNAESLTNSINMSVSSGNVYITDSEIPAQASGETVYYKILTTDNDALEASQNGSYEVSESNSINDFTKEKLSVYPNPVKDFITIQLENYTAKVEITIYNTLGSVLLSEKTDFNREYRMNLSDLDSGIYFISFVNDNLLITKMIVVKK